MSMRTKTRTRRLHPALVRNPTGRPPTLLGKRCGSVVGSEVALVKVGHGPVASAFAVDEAKALVEGASGDIVFAGAKVHVIRTAGTGDLDRALHQGPAQPLPPARRHDVQLGEIALRRVAPDGVPEAQHRDSVWPGPYEEDGGVAAGKQAPDP